MVAAADEKGGTILVAIAEKSFPFGLLPGPDDAGTGAAEGGATTGAAAAVGGAALADI